MCAIYTYMMSKTIHAIANAYVYAFILNGMCVYIVVCVYIVSNTHVREPM